MRAESLNFFRKKRSTTAGTDSYPSCSRSLDLHIPFFAVSQARLQDLWQRVETVKVKSQKLEGSVQKARANDETRSGVYPFLLLA